MTIHRLNDSGFALYIDADELAAGGLNDLCEKKARMLAEEAMSSLGISASSLCEIDAFMGHTGALIFANLRQGTQTVLVEFKNTDDLLFAAKMLKNPYFCRSALLRYNGKYILYSKECPDRDALLLKEFGKMIRIENDTWAFYREHGEILEKENAIARLKGFPAPEDSD